jgi:predicted peroxiredoxin
MFNCTNGKEDPERAILPFVAANVAATAGLEATVVCTIEAVWLGTKGGAEGVVKDGLPALATLLEEFRQNGGKVWLCGACAKPRGITEEHTAAGVTIVGAATIVEAIAKGATPVTFA